MKERRRLLGRAAAELLVIVAGVLIALWIEGWREARADAAERQEYLARLETDLLADSARIQDRIDAETSLTARVETALRFARGGWEAEPDTVGVLRAYHFSGFINFVRLRTTTWDDLVATGNLALLEDQALRQRLGTYYKNPVVDFLVEMDDNRKERIWYRYRPALDRYFPAGFLNGLASGEPPRPLPPVDYEAIRTDPEVGIGLGAAAGMAEIYLRQLGTLAAENAATLRAVRAAP